MVVAHEDNNTIDFIVVLGAPTVRLRVSVDIGRALTFLTVRHYTPSREINHQTLKR